MLAVLLSAVLQVVAGNACEGISEAVGLMQLRPQNKTDGISEPEPLPPGSMEAAAMQQIGATRSGTASAATYTVFENFESGVWPDPAVTYLTNNLAAKGQLQTAGGGAQGSNTYLAKVPNTNMEFARWPSPITSKVGTSMRAWYRRPDLTTVGRVFIGFDTTPTGTKALFLDAPGASTLDFRFYDIPNYAYQQLQGKIWTGLQQNVWYSIILTMESLYHVRARIFDDQDVLQTFLDGYFPASPITETGTLGIRLENTERHVDEIATCNELQVIQVTTDPGFCNAALSVSVPSCIPGIAFACAGAINVGTTQLLCSGEDAAGEETRAVQVTVVDAEPPHIPQQQNIHVTSACRGFAQVTFEVGATDNCVQEPQKVVPVCTPGSGSLFPVGSTTVTCIATDARGNVGDMSFEVIVDEETAPPVMTAPGNIQADAGCDAGVHVAFTATVTNGCGPMVPLCSPASGAWFPVGNTDVECKAMDSAGNSASRSFQVQVSGSGGSDPPSFGELPDIYAAAPSCTVAQVDFAVKAVGGCETQTECVPPSGSRFPVGRTKVSCTARDGQGNVAVASFLVKVGCRRPPRRRRRKAD